MPYGLPQLAVNPPTGLAPVFLRLGVWNRGIVTARWGARQHLGHPTRYTTLCGVNAVAMFAVYIERLHTLLAGTLRLINVRELTDADQVMLMVTCQDCLAALTAKRLLGDA